MLHASSVARRAGTAVFALEGVHVILAGPTLLRFDSEGVLTAAGCGGYRRPTTFTLQ